MSDDREPGRFARLSTAGAACMLLWIFRVLFGLLVGYPVVLAIQASGVTAGPEGDRVLFQPGSLLLLELLRIGAPWLASALRAALLLAALSAVLELLPLALALDLLWLPGRPLGERAGRALRLFPGFLALSGIALLAQAALLLATSLLVAAFKPVLSSSDERLQSMLPIALFGLGLLSCVGVGYVLDVARAALVQRERGPREALSHALVCFREQPASLLLGAYPSIAGGAFGYLSAAWLLTHLAPNGASNASLALGFAAHQLAVLFAIAWRVRWLDLALDLSADRY